MGIRSQRGTGLFVWVLVAGSSTTTRVKDERTRGARMHPFEGISNKYIRKPVACSCPRPDVLTYLDYVLPKQRSDALLCICGRPGILLPFPLSSFQVIFAPSVPFPCLGLPFRGLLFPCLCPCPCEPNSGVTFCGRVAFPTGIAHYHPGDGQDASLSFASQPYTDEEPESRKNLYT
ncbi:hypothetical protein JB92DRAFT_1669625 [Gautieria morchelliformis]|nr:hypothetical protein JB92DRAFT_1669625 [Gautieria morchelliformis]